MAAGGVLSPEGARFTRRAAVVIAGGGACGLTAALSAVERNPDVLVLERERVTLGTTAMSMGFIPAANTCFQREKGVDDSAERFAQDILAKNRGETDEKIVRLLAQESAPTVEWLAHTCGVPLSFVESEHYPGHSCRRMHGTPNRTGAELMEGLHSAATGKGVKVLTSCAVTALFADSTGFISGVRVEHGDGSREDIECDALILASGGFAANREMVAEHIPEIEAAQFAGHQGSTGDAIRWGTALGAAVADVHAYQSHGGLSQHAKMPVPWAHILHGGIQVNALGRRFSDESRNYAERALEVLAQPGRFVWSLFDERVHNLLLGFQPYRDLVSTGAVLTAKDVDELRRVTGLPEQVAETLRNAEQAVRSASADEVGRRFAPEPPLSPPYKAVKVTGALYHTQGGLVVDENARVLTPSGRPLPNLFAGGGAARGISGPGSWGYLGGNGLLSAVVLGRLAGSAAARLALTTSSHR
jgi:fumarate reductase flavoprotein subunit